MANMMISDDFHILVVQLLSFFFMLARSQISFIAMTGRQRSLYVLSNFSLSNLYNSLFLFVFYFLLGSFILGYICPKRIKFS